MSRATFADSCLLRALHLHNSRSAYRLLSLVSKRTSAVMCNVDIPSNTHHIAGTYNPTYYLPHAQMGNYQSDI